MRITGTGNVGIGINSPIAPLQFSNSSGRKLLIYDGSGGVGNNHQYNGLGQGAGTFEFHVNISTESFAFYYATSSTASVEIMRINSGGVGIGTTTTNSPLQFTNTATTRLITLNEVANNSFQFYGFGTGSGTLLYNIGANGSSNAHVFTAASSSSTSVELARITGTGDFILQGTAYLKQSYGVIYMTTNLTQTTLTANTWAKIAGTTITSSLNQFTSPSSNRLTYTGSTTINACAIGNTSIYSNAAVGTRMDIAIFKNGVQVGAPNYVNISTLAYVYSLTVYANVSLATNDYIEIWARTSVNSSTAATDLTLSVQYL
jgi:hypothetical protein